MAGAFAAALGLAFFAGFEVGYREFFPHDFLARVDRKLAFPFTEPAPVDPPIETGLITLQRETVAVNIADDLGIRRGGALTTFGDDVLALTYDGEIFAASSGATLRKTAIAAPPNNRDQYRADYRATVDASNGAVLAYAETYLRFNDIHFVDDASWRGLLVSFTEYHPAEKCVTNALARLPVSARTVDDVAAETGDWEIFLRTSPCLPFKTKGLAMAGQMAGGRMAQRADGAIYWTVGDFAFDGARNDAVAYAQDEAADYGKVLEVDLQSGAARAVARGFRNPQGIALDADGHLWVTDQGPRGGDELNLIKDGADYGWPRASLGTLYSKARLPSGAVLGRHDGFEAPAFAWMPSPAISSLMRIKGFHPAWDGDFLATALKSGSVFRLRVDGDRVVYAEEIPFGRRLRDARQLRDERIALWTEDHEIIFLSGEDLSDESARLADFVGAKNIGADAAARLEALVSACSECHSFAPGAASSAPSLAYVYGDPIAADPQFAYSHALAGKTGKWTRDNLAAFLGDPEKFAPGTTMPDPGLGEKDDIDAVIDYLEHLDTLR